MLALLCYALHVVLHTTSVTQHNLVVTVLGLLVVAWLQYCLLTDGRGCGVFLAVWVLTEQGAILWGPAEANIRCAFHVHVLYSAAAVAMPRNAARVLATYRYPLCALLIARSAHQHHPALANNIHRILSTLVHTHTAPWQRIGDLQVFPAETMKPWVFVPTTHECAQVSQPTYNNTI